MKTVKKRDILGRQQLLFFQSYFQPVFPTWTKWLLRLKEARCKCSFGSAGVMVGQRSRKLFAFIGGWDPKDQYQRELKWGSEMPRLEKTMTSPHCVPTDRRSTSPCGGAGLMVLRRPRRIDWVDGPPCPWGWVKAARDWAKDSLWCLQRLME